MLVLATTHCSARYTTDQLRTIYTLTCSPVSIEMNPSRALGDPMAPIRLFSTAYSSSDQLGLRLSGRSVAVDSPYLDARQRRRSSSLNSRIPVSLAIFEGFGQPRLRLAVHKCPFSTMVSLGMLRNFLQRFNISTTISQVCWGQSCFMQTQEKLT